MRTSNPAFQASAYSEARQKGKQNAMTVGGTVNKTLLLTAFLIVTAAMVWRVVAPAGGPAVNTGLANLFILTGSLGGLGITFALMFRPHFAVWLAPAYSVMEGLFIGSLSVLMEHRFPGIVMQAAMATMATLASLLLAYKSGFLRVTDRFRSCLVTATGAIFVVYLFAFVLRLFGVQMPFLHDSSPLSIGISVVVTIVAALNLVLDFDYIEDGADRGAPKEMEWYAAWGLLVTLVWLYVEFLRLLAKLRGRK